MKTSLVIPCTPYHFCNSLVNVLRAYEGGTIKPDEVIVSLSEAPLVREMTIKQETARYLKKCISGKIFKEFDIIRHNGKKTHGPNRQEGSNAATGDIIIYNDADDIPHHQRVEAIKHCFETTDAMHINHWWCHESCDFATFNMKEIKIISPEEVNKKIIQPYHHLHYAEGGYGNVFGRVHGGNTSIKKEVLQQIRWKGWTEFEDSPVPAEDWLFCYETAYTYKKSIILQLDLIKYVGEAADSLWGKDKWCDYDKYKSAGIV